MNIVFLLDQVLDALSIDQHNTISRIAALFLIVFSTFILILMLSASYNRLRRRWVRRKDSAKAAHFRNLIRQFLENDSAIARNSILRETHSTLFNRMERGFFRRLLQQQIRGASPSELVRLRQLYKEAGLYAIDVANLYSWFWWKRLSAAVRLERLKDLSLSPLFEELMSDKNELVALVAIRACSKLGTAIEPLLEQVSRRAPARRDIFVEILLSLADHNPDQVMRYLAECYDPFIASLCIYVLGERKVKKAMPELVQLISSSSDEVVVSSIQALRKMNDPEIVPVLQNLIRHPNNLVRAQALSGLLQFGKADWAHLHSALANDSSIEVKRILYESRILAGVKLS